MIRYFVYTDGIETYMYVVYSFSKVLFFYRESVCLKLVQHCSSHWIFFFQLYIYMIDLISFDKAVLLITLSDT